MTALQMLADSQAAWRDAYFVQATFPNDLRDMKLKPFGSVCAVCKTATLHSYYLLKLNSLYGCRFEGICMDLNSN
jgi:hypothetical protein